jgi:hypothetical protein
MAGMDETPSGKLTLANLVPFFAVAGSLGAFVGRIARSPDLGFAKWALALCVAVACAAVQVVAYYRIGDRLFKNVKDGWPVLAYCVGFLVASMVVAFLVASLLSAVVFAWAATAG